MTPEQIAAAFMALPQTKPWPNDKGTEEWFVRLDDAVPMVEGWVREALDGSRLAHPSTGPAQGTERALAKVLHEARGHTFPLGQCGSCLDLANNTAQQDAHIDTLTEAVLDFAEYQYGAQARREFAAILNGETPTPAR